MHHCQSPIQANSCSLLFFLFCSSLYFSYTHGEFCFVLTSHYFPSHTSLQTSNFASAIQLLFLWAAFFSYHYAFVLNSWNEEKAQLIVSKFPKENFFTFPQFEITFWFEEKEKKVPLIKHCIHLKNLMEHFSLKNSVIFEKEVGSDFLPFLSKIV